MNRREALIAGVIGAATGVTWAGGLGLFLNRHDPTLEVVGEGDALLALLDTGTFRALFVVGNGLGDRMDSLLGVFRRRIDLLAGSQRGIVLIGDSRPAGLRLGRNFVLDVPVGIAGSVTEVEANGPAGLRATLPDGLVLELHTHVHGAWQPVGAATQSWMVTISRNGHRCVLAPTLDVISAHAESGQALAIAAQGDPDCIWDMLRIPSVAVNATHFPGTTAADLSAFRIFPRNPLTFSFRTDGISVRE